MDRQEHARRAGFIDPCEHGSWSERTCYICIRVRAERREFAVFAVVVSAVLLSAIGVLFAFIG